MRTRPMWLALALATTVTSCRSGQPAQARLPRPMPEVDVTMRDYRFDYDPRIPSGLVLFRVYNRGHVAHELDVVPLADDVPPIAEQLAGNNRRTVAPIAAVRPRLPGSAGAFVVDLERGRRYAFLSFLSSSDNVSDARKGMASEFRPGS